MLLNNIVDNNYTKDSVPLTTRKTCILMGYRETQDDVTITKYYVITSVKLAY